MRYADPVPMPDGPILDMEATTATTFTSHIEDCRTCKGVGRVTSTERIPVLQEAWATREDGSRERVKERIGTVPHDFDPRRIKSTHWLYEPRPGDFREEDGAWVASWALGPGDLEAVPGFVWDRHS